VRTFLRTYADFLGLDSQLLVEEYRTTHEAPAYDEAQPLTPPPATRPRAREGRRRGPIFGRGATIAAAILAILALLLVIGLLGDDGGEDPAEERPARGDTERAPRDEEGRGRAEEESELVALRIEPAAETYLCVENGEGEELVNTNVTSPETVEGKTLRVLFGNTLAVEATANGEPVELAESADPIGIEVTPEGQEELAEGELPCQ
jgi:cytoskeletal protein RodZ